MLYWSPAGGMLLLATLGESSGALEFYDADHDVSKVEEHYKMTHIEWDPSGRTLCTAVCQPLDGAFFKFQMDNGYKIWTWQGELLNDVRKEAFYQFSWRPRPKSLLSEEAREDRQEPAQVRAPVRPRRHDEAEGARVPPHGREAQGAQDLPRPPRGRPPLSGSLEPIFKLFQCETAESVSAAEPSPRRLWSSNSSYRNSLASRTGGC